MDSIVLAATYRKQAVPSKPGDNQSVIFVLPALRTPRDIRKIAVGTMVAFPNSEWAFEDTGLDRPSEKTEDRASRIACEVLRYLLEHPDAQDTLQGITDWWLMERRIDEQSALVKAALARLVNRGFVVEERRGALPIRYRINKGRYDEIAELTRK